MPGLIIPAPAKINIGLQIGEIRPDGYHSIETVMQTVGLYDYVEISRARSFSLTALNYEFPAEQTNLCEQAYNAFLKYTGVEMPVSVKLEKNIPVGSGLGGGSSDAAAVLKGLSSLAGINFRSDAVLKAGAEIGSDVTFFLTDHQGSAFCSGRGEIVESIDPLWPGWVVIVFTGLHISTDWAYKSFDDNLTNCKKIVNFKRFILSCFPAQKGLNDVQNDFNEVVFKKHPVLKEVALSLHERGSSYSSLSGSGSAVYGLFATEESAYEAAANLPPYELKAVVKTPATDHQ